MKTRKRATGKTVESPFTEVTPKSAIGNKKKRTVSSVSTLFKFKASSPPINNDNDNHKNLSSISDLKDFASSRLDEIKRNLIDLSHAEILKELEASNSRLNKRFKIQTQTCQQVMDEAEKEYKKISEWSTETQEAMMASYAEFVEDAQATASRVCKTSIDDLSKSLNKEINDLKSRFGIPTTCN